MAICLDVLIALGKAHYGSDAIGSSIAFTAFALMLIVAAYECRSAARHRADQATPSTTSR